MQIITKNPKKNILEVHNRKPKIPNKQIKIDAIEVQILRKK